MLDDSLRNIFATCGVGQNPLHVLLDPEYRIVFKQDGSNRAVEPSLRAAIDNLLLP